MNGRVAWACWVMVRASLSWRLRRLVRQILFLSCALDLHLDVVPQEVDCHREIEAYPLIGLGMRMSYAFRASLGGHIAVLWLLCLCLLLEKDSIR